jgi:hypothetical protein
MWRPGLGPGLFMSGVKEKTRKRKWTAKKTVERSIREENKSKEQGNENFFNLFDLFDFAVNSSFRLCDKENSKTIF